jgi:hypothetical protein
VDGMENESYRLRTPLAFQHLTWNGKKKFYTIIWQKGYTIRQILTSISNRINNDVYQLITKSLEVFLMCISFTANGTETLL